MAASSFILGFIFLNIPSSGLAQNGLPPPTELSTEVIEPAETKIAPEYYPVPDTGPLPFAGENHEYSVVLRGNGEAIITLKAALSNTKTDEELNNVSLRLPSRIVPTDIAVYQIIAQGYCMRYDERQYYPLPSGIPYKYSPPRCLEYSQPDYYNYYGGGKYQRAKFEYSGDTLDITLPKPIQSEKSGAFLVYFRAMGFARRNIFGAYKFYFESIKTNNSINNLTVGISPDTDLFIKGGQGEVEYRYGNADAMMKMMKTPELKGGAAMTNPTIDNYISQIGQGSIVKNAANLAPLESYKVSGMYANSRLKLYGKEIVISLTGLLVAVLLILLVARKILKMINQATAKKDVKIVQAQDNSTHFLVTLGISFISSVILGGYSIILILLFNYLNYADYQIAQVVRAAAIIFSFCIYTVGLFIPGLYYGYKKGMGWGVLTVVLTVVWLFIYFVIGIVLVFLFGFNRAFPIGMPMIEKY